MTKGIISVDSLKVRIPYSQVQILSDQFEQRFLTIKESDGEVVEDFKKNRYAHIENGITTSYGAEYQRGGNGHVGHYVVILINAKLLKSMYLSGINIENIRTIYEEIISQQVVYFEFKYLLKAECTDIDYKMDVLCDNLDRVTKKMKELTKPSKNIKHGCNRFSKKFNKGIEYGKRNTASPSYPYLKVYDKSRELMYNSTEFSDAHQIKYPANLVRLEFTLKNKKHLKKYGIVDSTLANILNLDNEKLSSILKNILSIHLERRTKAPIMRENLLPLDQALYAYTVICLQDGHMLDSLLDAITAHMNKDQRYSMKKRIMTLYEHHIKQQDVGQINEDVSNFFMQIGWN